MPTDDFFHACLDQKIDLRPSGGAGKSVAVDSQIEAALAPASGRKNRQGEVVKINGLFGTALAIMDTGVSAARLPIRLMVLLPYLKRRFNLSDEELATRRSGM